MISMKLYNFFKEGKVYYKVAKPSFITKLGKCYQTIGLVFSGNEKKTLQSKEILCEILY